jgi:hypothetical protein
MGNLQLAFYSPNQSVHCFYSKPNRHTAGLALNLAMAVCFFVHGKKALTRSST